MIVINPGKLCNGTLKLLCEVPTSSNRNQKALNGGTLEGVGTSGRLSICIGPTQGC